MVDPLKAKIQVREVQGHKDVISQIFVDQEDGFVVTSSNDMQIRLWSVGLDMWGYIHQMTEKIDPLWFFPDYVIENRKKQDLKVTIDVLSFLNQGNTSVRLPLRRA